MRQAIVTRYCGPTDKHESRVSARTAAGCILVSWDHSLSHEANHRAAAEAFALKFNWTGGYVGGALPNGDYVFVNIDGDSDGFCVE